MPKGKERKWVLFLLLFFNLWAVSPSEAKGMNRLRDSRSNYLKSASQQPVHWYEWSEEAFQAAQKEDKPILLDIGAVWCHWCHVIDRESYENPEIARLINELYIPIKVDVDARPDIDRRYQEAVQALTGQGGWPLTVFLTPDGQVITGGTYFPPEDRWGMPGMKTILPRIAEAYRQKKADVTAQAKRLHEELIRISEQGFRSGALGPEGLGQIVSDLVNSFDEEQGGFGSAPKFPPPTALELLLRRYVATGKKQYLQMVTRTLDRIASGGMRDQLAGAFHRYSTDRFWRVPHFEVMLYVNAELLKVYAYGYQITQDPRYAQVIEGLFTYLRQTLSDTVHGGFYGSQDADYSPEDDGDYWTWTLTEAKEILTPEELEVAGRFYGIEEQGEMRENPAKNVLYETIPLETLAKLLGKPESEVRTILHRGRGKLLAARGKRKAPFVDRTIYTNWNGLMISGMLAASQAVGNEQARDFAVKSLERIFREARGPKGELFHVLQDGKAHTRGFLDDYAYLLNALLDAYEVTQEPVHLKRAYEVAEGMIAGFWDEKQGGFFDIPAAPKEKLSILRHRRKPIQDAPTPSGNSMAALGLTRLFHATGEPKHQEIAQRTLASFAGTATGYGLFAASFGIALDAFLEEPTQVVVLGKITDPRTQDLLKAALSIYRPNRFLQVADSSSDLKKFPPAVAELVKNAKGFEVPTAFVCAGTQCAPPTASPEELKGILGTFGLVKAGSP